MDLVNLSKAILEEIEKRHGIKMDAGFLMNAISGAYKHGFMDAVKQMNNIVDIIANAPDGLSDEENFIYCDSHIQKLREGMFLKFKENHSSKGISMFGELFVDKIKEAYEKRDKRN